MVRSFLTTILAIAIAGSVQAQDSLSALHSHDEVLNEVVVTGTRTPKLLASAPVLTRVISHADIEKADATDLRDILEQEVPGVEFSYSMNQMRHMNFSGFGGQSMLILVDGERLAGETMDDVDFARLTMDNVDHIEIVRGAASALYGPNAAGGVINIITRKAVKRFGLNVNGRWGRHGEQRYGLKLENSGSNWGNTLTVTRTRQDNYDVKSGSDPVTRVISTIYGDKTWNFHDQASWRLTPDLELRGRAGYFFREQARSADNPERYRDFSGGLRALWNLGRNGRIDAAYSFDQYDKSDYQRIARLDIRDYSNVQNAFRLLYTLPIGKHTFNAGADYMHDYLFNDKLDGQKRNQDSFDFFAQFDWFALSNLEMVGAVRYDYFSEGHTQRVTPKFSLRWEPLTHFNIRFGYGMGFRAPTLKEKYYDYNAAGIWLIKGNPDLVPEVSHNHNLSFDYVWRHYDFTLSGYYNRIKNKLGTGVPYFATPADRTPTLPYVNLKDYYVKGFEATVQARWSYGVSARLAYAFTDEQQLKQKDGETANNQFIPARKHNLNVHADWTRRLFAFYRMAVAIDGRVLSGVDNVEFIDYYNVSRGTTTVHYPAYTLWKLSTSHFLGKREAVKVTLAVDNLFNYEPRYHYLNAPLTDGANFMVGVFIDIDKLWK